LKIQDFFTSAKDNRPTFALLSFFVIGLSCLTATQNLQAQQVLSVSDLSFFRASGPSWRMVGDVRADLAAKDLLIPTSGTGILLDLPDTKNSGSDLYSSSQFGDMDLELDFLMGVGSNSGIYLQGRYEIQLLDSWGVIHPTAADNGGIYERWDDGKPEGHKGYEGIAPRQNASRAPGLWQHIKISFQAPRFNDGGTKISNARILRVELNGVLVQENVELSGPTRGAMENNEVPRGPLRLQGDHGPVAFRHLSITTYDQQRPEIVNIHYSIYKGIYKMESEYKKLQPEIKGESSTISFNVNTLPKECLLRYTGIFRAKAAGEYTFKLNTSGGTGLIRINNQTVVPLGKPRATGKIDLPAGDLPFELVYSKLIDYAKPALGLSVSGPGIRQYAVSEVSGDVVDPILVNASENIILRSFSDVSDSIRVTHAVNVGSPLQVHYTYDLDKGMIVQVWRGGFLEATTMWRGRGDGSSRPLGMVQRFGKPMLALEELTGPDAPWVNDTAGTGYRPKGYVLDDSDRPTFRYLIYNARVNDRTRILPDGHGLQREISIQGAPTNLYSRLAEGKTMEMISEGLYLVDDKSYYIRIDDSGGVKPIVRDNNGQKELLVPIQSKIIYSILF
jgi:hypothetical protein